MKVWKLWESGSFTGYEPSDIPYIIPMSDLSEMLLRGSAIVRLNENFLSGYSSNSKINGKSQTNSTFASIKGWDAQAFFVGIFCRRRFRQKQFHNFILVFFKQKQTKVQTTIKWLSN
jgi:hypothetical protein